MSTTQCGHVDKFGGLVPTTRRDLLRDRIILDRHKHVNLIDCGLFCVGVVAEYTLPTYFKIIHS